MAITSNTSEGMKAAGQEFVNTYGSVDRIMKDLRSELNNLRSQWDGSAASVFEQTMTQWGAEFDNVLKELDAMADKLLGGAGHVMAAEDMAIAQGAFFK